MKSSNICLTKEGCIIEISRKRILTTAIVVVVALSTLMVSSVWCYFVENKHHWVYICGVVMCGVIVPWYIMDVFRTLRNPPPPMVLDKQGIVFPALPNEVLLPKKKLLWNDIFYLFFRSGGHGVPHQLEIWVKGRDFFQFSSWSMYCSRRQLMDLIEEYAGREMFVKRKLYFFRPSEEEIQQFRDERRKDTKRLKKQPSR